MDVLYCCTIYVNQTCHVVVTNLLMALFFRSSSQVLKSYLGARECRRLFSTLCSSIWPGLGAGPSAGATKCASCSAGYTSPSTNCASCSSGYARAVTSSALAGHGGVLCGGPFLPLPLLVHSCVSTERLGTRFAGLIYGCMAFNL